MKETFKKVALNTIIGGAFAAIGFAIFLQINRHLDTPEEYLERYPSLTAEDAATLHEDVALDITITDSVWLFLIGSGIIGGSVSAGSAPSRRKPPAPK